MSGQLPTPEPLLRVLHIEDSPADAELISEALAAAGFDIDCRRVDNEQALEAALADGPWDLILSDHMLPGFGSLQALRTVARHDTDAPFVIVSGRIGEEAVAQALRQGAVDYVNKDDLEAFGETIRRALAEAEARARQRSAERAARDAKALMQSLMDHAPFAMSLRDLEGRFQIVNRLGAELMGKPAEEYLGRTLEDLFGPDVARTLEEHEVAVRISGQAITREVAGTPAEDTPRDYLVTKYPVRDSEGQLVGIGGISLDMTERRVTAERLREAEARFRGAFDSAAIGMAIVAPDGRWLEVNQAICDIVGYSEEELLGGDFQSITHPDDLEEDMAGVRQMLSGEIQTYQIDKRYIHKLGHPVSIRLSVSLVRDPCGQPSYFVSQIQDISDEKRAEELDEQLRHAQRLDAIGRLAGGVAHDFNNMLTAIKGYSEILLGSLEPDDPRRTSAEQISRAADQAATLPRQLLAFSRKQVFEPEVMDVNAVTGAASDMLHQLLGEKVKLDLRADAKPASVLADPGQVEQVLLNLALNGRDAMPDGGNLTIATRNQRLDASAALTAGVEPGDYIVIAVRDEGIGMDNDVLEHIFEPFFTTKATGSGLGLATVYGIARQNKGFVRVESQPGNGSRIEMWIPASDAHLDGDSVGQAMSRPEPTPLTVLVAEDEPIVRELAVNVLENAGYRVLAAASGETALALACEQERPIDLLLTDMVMPGMGGRELAAQLLQTRPEMRTVLMSGYSEEEPRLNLDARHPATFIAKPFTPSALISRLAELLDADGPPGANPTVGVSPTCVVADDHPAVLDSVSQYLQQQGINVVARAADGEEALAAIAQHQPAVALLDVRMPTLSGIDVARRAAIASPATRIALFTGYGDRAMLTEALEAGARAFVLKETPLGELAQALKRVADGGTYVSAQLTATLASSATAKTLSPLTARESQILALVADGMTNEKAAAELGISAETVQSHVRNAMSKLDADTRTQAVATAFRRSILV